MSLEYKALGWGAFLLVLAAAPRAGAEVRSLTLGITMNCPYGLGG